MTTFINAHNNYIINKIKTVINIFNTLVIVFSNNIRYQIIHALYFSYMY